MKRSRPAVQPSDLPTSLPTLVIDANRQGHTRITYQDPSFQIPISVLIPPGITDPLEAVVYAADIQAHIGRSKIDFVALSDSCGIPPAKLPESLKGGARYKRDLVFNLAQLELLLTHLVDHPPARNPTVATAAARVRDAFFHSAESAVETVLSSRDRKFLEYQAQEPAIRLHPVDIEPCPPARTAVASTAAALRARLAQRRSATVRGADLQRPAPGPESQEEGKGAHAASGQQIIDQVQSMAHQIRELEGYRALGERCLAINLLPERERYLTFLTLCDDLGAAQAAAS